MKSARMIMGISAALGLASGAMAADAIVAAEPETVEYVRVCDAFGTGYFYIPGTETCLSVGGYIRTEARFGRNRSGTSDYSLWTRAQTTFSAKSDTEFGPLTGVITLRANAENATSNVTLLQEGFIDIAGLRAGMQYSFWDDSPSGDTDVVSSNSTIHNSLRYLFTGTSVSAGISLDELEERYDTKPGEGPNNLGVTAQLFAESGAISGYLLAGYDTDTQEAAIRAFAYADIGPGELGIYGVWASGANYYYEESQWTVGAQYALKVTDKLSLTPGYQYFSKTEIDGSGSFGGANAWKAGLTTDYKIAKNLATKLSVQYYDVDDADGQVLGFLRLQRTF